MSTLDSHKPITHLALIGMMAFSLRAVVFSLTPLLPRIRADLHLSFSEAGALTSLVVACLALGAFPGAKLSNRVGPKRLIVLASFLLVLGGVLRTVIPGAFWLPVGTGLATMGLACSQPATIVLIGRWFPTNVQRATTVFVSGQQAGSVGGFVLTPVLAPYLGWRGSLDVWTALALVSALIWSRSAWIDGSSSTLHTTPLRILIRDPNLWLAAAIVTAQGTTYFCVAAWLPFLLQGANPGYAVSVFFLFNAVALVPALLVAFRWRFASSRPYYVAAGLMAGAGAVAMLLGFQGWAWLAALGVGLGTTMCYMGIVAIAPRLARRNEDVAMFSAAILFIGYAGALLGPLAGGIVVDVTHHVDWSFWPAVVSGILMVVFGLRTGAFSRKPDKRGHRETGRDG